MHAYSYILGERTWCRQHPESFAAHLLQGRIPEMQTDQTVASCQAMIRADGPTSESAEESVFLEDPGLTPAARAFGEGLRRCACAETAPLSLMGHWDLPYGAIGGLRSRVWLTSTGTRSRLSWSGNFESLEHLHVGLRHWRTHSSKRPSARVLARVRTTPRSRHREKKHTLRPKPYMNP